MEYIGRFTWLDPERGRQTQQTTCQRDFEAWFVYLCMAGFMFGFESESTDDQPTEST